MDKIPMTLKGFAVAQAELKRLISEERPRIIEAISEARAHGDLSENAEYHAAKEAQSMNEARISELEDKLGRVDAIDPAKISGDTIKFGATAKLMDEDTEEEKTFMIVGEIEADPRKGKLSISSPMARALIGKKVGDIVDFNTPGGAKSYEVLSIQYV
jgi:transcription elongation factor GreA